MKKRGMRPPDLADAFLLTFAGGWAASHCEPDSEIAKLEWLRGGRGPWHERSRRMRFSLAGQAQTIQSARRDAERRSAEE